MTKKTTPKIKVTLSQNGVSATFRLTNEEYKQLRNYSDKKHGSSRMGDMYNFSAFAWADYEISRSKCGRFHSLFNYHDGDFLWYLEEEE